MKLETHSSSLEFGFRETRNSHLEFGQAPASTPTSTPAAEPETRNFNLEFGVWARNWKPTSRVWSLVSAKLETHSSSLACGFLIFPAPGAGPERQTLNWTLEFRVGRVPNSKLRFRVSSLVYEKLETPSAKIGVLVCRGETQTTNAEV